MVDTSSNVVGNYDSEELVDLYNQDEEHEAFNEAIQAEVDEIAGDDGIDDGEQEEIDEWLSNIDEVGAAWDELLEGLEDTGEDDMTDAEISEKEGYEDRSKECMDVLKEAITVAEDRVEIINESTMEIGDDGGTIEATENTEIDLTVQLDGSANPLADDSDTDGLIYNVTDPDDETNILEGGRIPITIDTPELTLQSYDGSTIVFTYEGKDEDGNVVQRKITINDYDYTKYVIYFEGDSIQDIEKISSWHKEILGSSVCGDNEWSNLVEVEGINAWDVGVDVTSDEIINQAITFIPEAEGSNELIKQGIETIWQGWIDGELDDAWSEVQALSSNEETRKAMIEAIMVAFSLDSDFTEFVPIFFDAVAPTLQSYIDLETATASDLLFLMLSEQNTSYGASYGGIDLCIETLFGDGEIIDGEFQNPEVALEAMDAFQDIAALGGFTVPTSLTDAYDIQSELLADGGYFSISDDQYEEMFDIAMTVDDVTTSGMAETDLRNALIQALAQFQGMGMSTVEEARTNFLTVVNSVAGSLGDVYLDDVTAGLLYLLMCADGGSAATPSDLYVSLVGTGDSDSILFMSQVEPLINNGFGEPIYFNEIKDDFKSRGYEFEVIEEPAAPTPDTVWDGAIGGMLAGAGIGAGIGFMFGGPVGALIGGGIGLVVGFFTGGAWDAAVESTTTWAAEAWDTITFWD